MKTKLIHCLISSCTAVGLVGCGNSDNISYSSLDSPAKSSMALETVVDSDGNVIFVDPNLVIYTENEIPVILDAPTNPTINPSTPSLPPSTNTTNTNPATTNDDNLPVTQPPMVAGDDNPIPPSETTPATPSQPPTVVSDTNNPPIVPPLPPTIMTDDDVPPTNDSENASRKACVQRILNDDAPPSSQALSAGGVIANRSGQVKIGNVVELTLQNISGRTTVNWAQKLVSAKNISGNLNINAGTAGPIADISGYMCISAGQIESYTGGSGRGLLHAAEIGSISMTSGRLEVSRAHVKSIKTVSGRVCLRDGATVDKIEVGSSGHVGTCK